MKNNNSNKNNWFLTLLISLNFLYITLLIGGYDTANAIAVTVYAITKVI